jgi:chemotaxis protein MotB
MKNHIIAATILVFAFSSCVSKRKFQSEQKRVGALELDSAGTHASLADCNLKSSVLKGEKDELQKAMSDLSYSSQTSIKNSNMTIADQAKRLKDLQMLIQAQKDVLTKLKKTVADALVNFKPDEVSVELKDGRLYVSLQEKLLFKSGSAVVDPKGKEALATLATVLNITPDISVLIEGHTDNVPVSGKYEDNWSLSVARSTAMVRVLTMDYKVDPKTITAAGRAEFAPVADNSQAEGRARNRRIEIILSPNLTELFKLINQ